MSRVTIELPSILAHLVKGDQSVSVEAKSLDEALRALVQHHPALEVHLFDETGGFREHVLCFHNETNTRWLDSIDIPLSEGDTITILQAVAGG